VPEREKRVVRPIRAPYFHNGSAETLADVVRFYDARFNIHLTAEEQTELIAFLRSL
jgi:cytochrome c peroxidase